MKPKLTLLSTSVNFEENSTILTSNRMSPCSHKQNTNKQSYLTAVDTFLTIGPASCLLLSDHVYTVLLLHAPEAGPTLKIEIIHTE